MFFQKSFIFHLPNLKKEIIIKAYDESTAVWKLFQLFKLRENEVDNYILKEVR